MIGFNKSGIAVIFITLILSGSCFFTGCAGGDSATVRINILLPAQESAYKPGITDRILAFFMISTSLKADTPPIEDPAIDAIRVTVSGSGMTSITRFADVVDGYIEMEVPSGSGRRFEVRAGYAYSGQQGQTLYFWYYGSETIVDLSAGETKNLQPVMIGIPNGVFATSGNGLDISWNLYGTAASDYIIQAASQAAGPYETIYPGSGTLNTVESPYYNDMDSPITSGYIRIKAIMGANSGLYSEPVEIQGIF